ncbi:MAG: hypothetical protein U5R31_11295 [Acidimicrobiia bacterium]|nr:hypothetical protein [Acidimicrobiia bacterium]
MYRLAKLGFSQSYTYFTWRQHRHGSYASTSRSSSTSRVPSSSVPTPGRTRPTSSPSHLAGRAAAAFVMRLRARGHPVAQLRHLRPRVRADGETRAAQSGERGVPRRREVRDPHVGPRRPRLSLRPLITARQRHPTRGHPALQRDARLRFHEVDNDELLCFTKTAPASDSAIVVVNLDPDWAQSGWVHLDLGALGIEPGESFEVHDRLSDTATSGTVPTTTSSSTRTEQARARLQPLRPRMNR